MRGLNSALLLVMLAAGAAMLWWTQQQGGVPYVGNDAYQYLDAASHIASGQCACGEVAHFDEQVSYGRMPVPFTHFPPGYPVLIALVQQLGVGPETGAYIVSIIGFLGVLVLLFDIALQLGASPWVTAAFSALWAGHAAAVSSGASVGTEAIFTAVLMLFAAAMVRDLRAAGARPWLLLCIAAAAPAAYWIRQAGLFLVPVGGAYLAWRWWQTRTARSWALGGLALTALLTGSLQLRNVIYTGSWRGGFNSGASHSVRYVLVETAKAVYHLVFGDRVVARFDIWSIVFLLSAAAVVWFTAQAWRRQKSSGPTLLQFAWPTLIVLVFSAGVMAAALVSIAADFTRYYLPVYPLVLALASAAFCQVPVAMPRAVSLYVCLGAVAAIQSRSLVTARPDPPHVDMLRRLNAEVPPVGPLRSWLLAQLGPQDSVFAVHGQAVQYVLKRPVVSMIEPEYSGRTADEAFIHQQMTTFRSRYMLLFPSLPAETSLEQSANPFLNTLASGAEPPAWLTAVGRTRDVAVFECRSCAP